MIYKEEVEATTTSGFPVLLRGTLCPPEPDAGFPCEYIDDLQVLTRRGYPADFLKLSEEELDRLAVIFHEECRPEPEYQPDES